jgi:hypothetical protein
MTREKVSSLQLNKGEKQMMKLIEVRRDNEETEILLLDVISTHDEWEKMNEEEHRRVDELLANQRNDESGMLVARDPDDGSMIIFPEDTVVATLDKYNFATVVWAGKFPNFVCRILRK